MDSNNGFMYVLALFFMVFVLVYIGGQQKTPPITAQQLADRLCQELYGPQTGAIWVEGEMKCQTVRGEILNVRSM